MAIAHIAMFETVNAIVGGYHSYAGIRPAAPGSSMKAAIAQAAHDALVALYPAQTVSLDRKLASDLRKLGESRAKSAGISLGRRAAAAVLAMRADDGSHPPEPRVGIEFIPRLEPGLWRQDPISEIPLALGARWGTVRPFVMKSPEQFRAPRPPRLDSEEYTTAFEEVKRLGGDGIGTPTKRTAEQTTIGIYWAYDGVPNLCAPPASTTRSR